MEGEQKIVFLFNRKNKTLFLQLPSLILLSVFYARLFTATETVAGRRNAEQWCIKLPPHHTTQHHTAPHRSPPTLLVWKAGVSRCSLMAFWSRLAIMVSPPTPECGCQRVKCRGNGNYNHDTEERQPQHAAWRQISQHTCTHCQKLTNGHKHFEKTVKKKILTLCLSRSQLLSLRQPSV